MICCHYVLNWVAPLLFPAQMCKLRLWFPFEHPELNDFNGESGGAMQRELFAKIVLAQTFRTDYYSRTPW